MKTRRERINVEQAVETYGDMVWRLALIQMKNKSEAEDVFQEVFLRLLRDTTEFRDSEHLKAWLLRVTVNHCKNHLASAWFRKRADLDEGIPALDNAELEVVSAVAALPAKYRAVVHLYYFEGYSTKEIAEILHSRPNTVSSRLSRARALLAKALKEEIV